MKAAALLDKNKDCRSLFGAREDNPGDLMRYAADNGFIDVESFKNVDDPNIPAEYNDITKKIYIGSDRAFFTGLDSNGNSLVGPGKQFLTLEMLQDVILIHELLHMAGVAGPDDKNQQITLGNGQKVNGTAGITAAVKQHCFGG